MAEPENETEPKPEKPKAKKAKADEALVDLGKTEPAPATQDAAPVVSEQPAAKAEPVVKRAKKPAKTKKEEAAPSAAPENLSLSTDDIEKPKVVKAKGSKNVHTGIAHVLSTFNNTIVTITDMNGNVIGWSSAGKVGFKGSRKSTAYAAQMVAQDASRQAMGHGLKEVEVLVRGPGAGRESAVRALQAVGLDLTLIR